MVAVAQVEERSKSRHLISPKHGKTQGGRAGYRQDHTAETICSAGPRVHGGKNRQDHRWYCRGKLADRSPSGEKSDCRSEPNVVTRAAEPSECNCGSEREHQTRSRESVAQEPRSVSPHGSGKRIAESRKESAVGRTPKPKADEIQAARCEGTRNDDGGERGKVVQKPERAARCGVCAGGNEDGTRSRHNRHGSERLTGSFVGIIVAIPERFVAGVLLVTINAERVLLDDGPHQIKTRIGIRAGASIEVSIGNKNNHYDEPCASVVTGVNGPAKCGWSGGRRGSRELFH